MTRLAAALLFLLSTTAYARPHIDSSQCGLVDGQWTLTAQTVIALAPDPVAALKSGIPLYFRYEAQFQPNGSWFGSTAAGSSLRLSYNHITYTYQLEDSASHSQQTFSSLEDALKALGSPVHALLIPEAPLAQTAGYTVRIRFTLEADKLPFSLRLTALTSDAWQLSTEWQPCPQNPA